MIKIAAITGGVLVLVTIMVLGGIAGTTNYFKYSKTGDIEIGVNSEKVESE